MRLRGLTASLAIVVGLGAPAMATPALHAPLVATPPHPVAPAARAGSPTCPIAARVELSLPDDIDEVRAIVASSAPGASTAVTVLDGSSDRQLSTFGSGVWGLQFSSPLRAGHVIVSVEPVLDAPASACIDQIELLRRGAVVARVIPR